MAATVWYFAYGSNLSRAQVRSRAGEILEERLARLDNYEVVFNKKARGGTATANIRPAPGETVYGVLYRLTEAGLRALDRFEGVPEHYRRIEVTVVDQAGNRIPAQTYIATRVERGLKPASHYLQTILQGAAEHGLPEDYIESLKQKADRGG